MWDFENETAVAAEHCWKKIGVAGDASCDKLATLVHCRNCSEYSRAGRGLLDRDMLEEDVREWTTLLGLRKEVSATGQISVLVFRAGGEWLALKTGIFEAVREARPVHTVPFRSTDVFRGLVNVDGELLLSFSAERALGIEQTGDRRDVSQEEERQRMLVLNHNGERFVLLVPEVLGLRKISPESLEKVPTTISKAPAAVTTALFEEEGRRIGLLDENKLFESVSRSVVC